MKFTVRTGRQLQLAFNYLLETSSCITVHSQHDRCGADERSRHEHHVIMNLRNSADTESGDADAYHQASVMSD